MSQQCIGVSVTGLMPANESLSTRSTRKYIPNMFARTRRRGDFRDLPASRTRGRGEPDVAANQTSRRTRRRRPDVAALFLTSATRLRKITPRTRANSREKQYASYPDGGSDYTNSMASNGRKEDSRSSQEVDNQVCQRGREKKVPRRHTKTRNSAPRPCAGGCVAPNRSV